MHILPVSLRRSGRSGRSGAASESPAAPAPCPGPLCAGPLCSGPGRAAALGVLLLALVLALSGCIPGPKPAEPGPRPAPERTPLAVATPPAGASRCHALYDLTLLAVPSQTSRPVAQVPRGREMYLLTQQPNGYALLQDPVTGLKGWTRLAEVEPWVPRPAREEIPQDDLPPDR